MFGPTGNRTQDLLLTREALYRLSHRALVERAIFMQECYQFAYLKKNFTIFLVPMRYAPLILEFTEVFEKMASINDGT